MGSLPCCLGRAPVPPHVCMFAHVCTSLSVHAGACTDTLCACCSWELCHCPPGAEGPAPSHLSPGKILVGACHGHSGWHSTEAPIPPCLEGQGSNHRRNGRAEKLNTREVAAINPTITQEMEEVEHLAVRSLSKKRRNSGIRPLNSAELWVDFSLSKHFS